MRFRHLCGGALATVTNRASPFADAVRNWRMRAKWLGYACVKQTRLSDSLMAGRATVNHIQFGYPNLIDVGMVVGEQFLCIGACLREAHIAAFVALPFTEQILDRRDRQRDNE